MKKALIALLFLLTIGLRFWSIGQYPMGLNADEASLGYNAWSLMQTGKDEHANAWPLVFRSFDDYKPPLYVYMTIPFVAVMGLNIEAVRMVSAILGSLSVFFLGLIVYNLSKDKEEGFWLGLLSAFALALMPWHIHFSRGGWEVNSATGLALIGWYFWTKKSSGGNWTIGAVFLALSLYTYHSARITVPLISLLILVFHFKEIVKSNQIKHLITACVVGLLVCAPLIGQMLSPEGTSRFEGVSIFADSGPLWEALELRREHQNQNMFTRVLHSKYVTYSMRFYRNYMSHFSSNFLFINGDEIARSKTPSVGQLYMWWSVLSLVGFISLFKQKGNNKWLWLALLLVAPIPASLTFQSPHALRAQMMSLPLAVFVGMGVLTLTKVKYRKIVITGLVLLQISGTVRYVHQYIRHYPYDLPYAWQYGFEEIGKYVKDNGSKYNKIIISDRYDQPYILMAFYLRYPPLSMQKELVMTPRDKFGFSTARSLGNMEFRKVTQDDLIDGNLVIAADEGINGNEVYSVKWPNGDKGFRFYTK